MSLYELIETLWNVNNIEETNTEENKTGINRNIVECKSYGMNAFNKMTAELIETLWNVNNDIVYLVFCAKKRINRNIVECKYLLDRSNEG